MRTAAAFLATAASLWAQDKVKLEFKVDQGLAVVVESVSDSKEKVRVEQQGAVQEKNDLFSHSEQEYTDVVLEARNGFAKKVERTYAKSKFERKEFLDEEKKSGSYTLEGQKITLTDEGGARTKIEAPEAVDRKDLRDLNLREDPLRTSMPAEAVAPGHSWKMDEKQVLADANDQDMGIKFDKADFKCTFEKTEERGGDRCAILKSEGILRGTTDQGLTLVLKNEAVFALSLSRKIVVETEIKGSYELTGGGEGQPFKVSGSGEFTSKQRIRAK
jgi:hypothetical protein